MADDFKGYSAPHFERLFDDNNRKNAELPTYGTEIKNIKKILHSQGFFSKNEIEWYDKINRYGYIDLYNTNRIIREYLFFTKPDLNLIGGDEEYGPFNPSHDLNSNIRSASPFIATAYARNKNAVLQLQNSVVKHDGQKCPFMYLLSNALTGKLDLPGISDDSTETTSNLYGTSIAYRGHSYKSDVGFDFSLSFEDTPQLEVYTLAKTYDEYHRLVKLGECSPKKKYITNHILDDQFSIYKFMVGEDGETILYWAKLTGVYIKDVPRDAFSDPSDFKFSLSFHAQFVEDMSPMIIQEFNSVVAAYSGIGADRALHPKKYSSGYLPVYEINSGFNGVNNEWAKYPVVVAYSDNRSNRMWAKFDYRLKWYG